MGSPDYCGLHRPQLRPGGQPCRKGTLSSIAITPPTVESRRRARTGGQLKMIGRLYGYARVSGASGADANNLEIQVGCWPTGSRSSRTLELRATGTGPG